MKKNYASPTIFNASNMKLSATSRGSNALTLENPLEGAFSLPFALSGSMRVVIGLKDIGEKGAGLVKRKI